MQKLMLRAVNELKLGDGPEDGFPSFPRDGLLAQATNKHLNSCATLTSYGKSICYNCRAGGAGEAPEGLSLMPWV